jgi:S1-C subfamily serine protease
MKQKLIPMKSTLLLLCCMLVPVSLRAMENELEKAAEQLSAATCTVRIAVSKEPAPKATTPAAEQSTERRAAEEITVCTGVSLGDGLLVTFYPSPGDLLDHPPRVRVTLPGGEQATAQPRVVDRTSQLLLLEITNAKLPALKFTSQAPKVGGQLLTAAAAGVEAPAVSVGTLAAAERSLSNVDLPPLLQCDLRTMETSSGAGVVNRAGELVGVIAAVAPAGQNSNGWSYALGTRHLERLRKAFVAGKTIELKRQRPMAGFTLGAGDAEGVVRVERVQPDGPAAKMGIAVGDVVLEADELKLRSAYQAVDMILRKQPGDTVKLVVERGGQRRTVELELIGATGPQVAAAPNDPNDKSGDKGQLVQVGPNVKASLQNGKLVIQGSENGAPVAVDAKSVSRRSIGDEAGMLRLQLQGYERVIQSMQKEIEALRAETSKLRGELSEKAR